LFSLLRNHHDAEEVLAETAKVLWERFDQYEPNTEFRAWACRIAHYKALKHRTKAHRRHTVFSDSFLALVDEDAIIMADRLDVRARALADCLQKLPKLERKLIERRYAQNGSVAEIAKMIGQSVQTAYRIIARIHSALFDCINRALAE
jgi:RNA polymerase sigma-70 factor (ECF subfamily)